MRQQTDELAVVRHAGDRCGSIVTRPANEGVREDERLSAAWQRRRVTAVTRDPAGAELVGDDIVETPVRLGSARDGWNEPAVTGCATRTVRGGSGFDSDADPIRQLGLSRTCTPGLVEEALPYERRGDRSCDQGRDVHRAPQTPLSRAGRSSARPGRSRRVTRLVSRHLSPSVTWGWPRSRCIPTCSNEPSPHRGRVHARIVDELDIPERAAGTWSEVGMVIA